MNEKKGREKRTNKEIIKTRKESISKTITKQKRKR